MGEPRKLPIPTVEQAQALIDKCNDMTTPATPVTYMIRLGAQMFLSRRRYQKSDKFKTMNRQRAQRQREKHGESLSTLRSRLKKAEFRLSQLEMSPDRHQDRYDKALASALSLRRKYAARLGYDPDVLNESGELADIVNDTEQHEIAEAAGQ